MQSSLSLSVIVAVRNEAATLRRTLQSVLDSDLDRSEYEIIVVDDASTDGSAAIAARFADSVIRLKGKPLGPAYARNRGIEIARGYIVALLDADTVVQSDTLGRMIEALEARRDLVAISAAHDAEPGARNFMSQYWNLLLHFGEHRHPIATGHFGLGCSAIRRSVLVASGMYDEWRFTEPSLEGIELGQRLTRAGSRVFLDRTLEVTKLSSWNFSSVFRQVWRRSRQLTRSLGYQRTRASAPGEVVLTLTRAAIPALALLCAIGLSASVHTGLNWPLPLALGASGMLLTNFPVVRFFTRERGILFALAVAPVHFVLQTVGAVGLCVGWVIRDAIGDSLPDATTQAYAEVGVEMWPPVPKQRVATQK